MGLLTLSLPEIRYPRDLFSLTVSHQVTQYVTWKADPYSIATEAMPVPSTRAHIYL